MVKMARSLIVILSVGLSGCASPPAQERDQIEKQWGDAVTRLSNELLPLYPPSEQYQIGTVFAWESTTTDAGGPDYRPQTFRIGYVPEVAEEARRQLSLVFKLPGTQYAADGKINRATDQGAYAKPQTMSDTLPITAFPSYTLVSGRLFDFAASAPGQLFSFLFGLSFAEDTDLRVSVEDSNVLSLDPYSAERYLAAFCNRSDAPCSEARLRNVYSSIFRKPSERELNITLVSTAYMTRTINYTYLFRSAVAARGVAAQLEATKAFAEKAATLAASPTQPATANVDDRAARSARDQLLSTLLTSVNNDLNKLAGSQGGATATVGSYLGNGISLSQTFTRPLTFAFGGVSVRARDPWLGQSVSSSTGRTSSQDRVSTSSGSQLPPIGDLPPVGVFSTTLGSPATMETLRTGVFCRDLPDNPMCGFEGTTVMTPVSPRPSDED